MREGSSLTGSECGVPSTHGASVSIALGRLRHGVLLCCWLVGLALAVQGGIWFAATFTDVRWTEIRGKKEGPLIVKAEDLEREEIRSALDEREEPSRDPVNVNRVRTKYDEMLQTSSSLASGFGSIAVLAFMPLIGLGVLLASSSGTAGVEKTVSAFGWSLVVGLLVLPVGDLIGLPWEEGALWSYGTLTSQLDAGEEAALGMTFYARYVVLPAACLTGIALVGTRFGAGVRAGLLVKEDLRLDPALEREASNIRPSSLHGSRTAGAMRAAVGHSQEASVGGMTRTSAGEAPKRLI